MWNLARIISILDSWICYYVAYHVKNNYLVGPNHTGNQLSIERNWYQRRLGGSQKKMCMDLTHEHHHSLGLNHNELKSTYGLMPGSKFGFGATQNKFSVI